MAAEILQAATGQRREARADIGGPGSVEEVARATGKHVSDSSIHLAASVLLSPCLLIALKYK